jgi:membrane-associated protein
MRTGAQRALLSVHPEFNYELPLGGIIRRTLRRRCRNPNSLSNSIFRIEARQDWPISAATEQRSNESSSHVPVESTNIMTLTTAAASGFMDPMYWLGDGGVFGAAVLPGILLIVFIETGLLFPALPGDTLLFAGGFLAAAPHPPVNIWVLAPAVAVTAVLGDQCAYFIGRRIGPALFDKEDSRFFKRRYVTKSHVFFEKHGPKTIILARFLPLVRTFTPVVAGVAYMRYRTFLCFDIIGGVAWGAGLTLLGYFLGSRVPFVHDHLELVVFAIAIISGLPAITSGIHAVAVRWRRPAKRQAEQPG